MVAPEATPKKFTVTDHALQQYRQRYPGRLSRRKLEAEIFEQVTQGIAAGYIYSYKPKGFLLYGQKRTKLDEGQRFVYRQPNASVGFILKRFPQEDVVVTTLVRVGVSR